MEHVIGYIVTGARFLGFAALTIGKLRGRGTEALVPIGGWVGTCFLLAGLWYGRVVPETGSAWIGFWMDDWYRRGESFEVQKKAVAV